MDLPSIYLIEPYNCYAPKGRKKHLHEILEEQALLERIIAERVAAEQASVVGHAAAAAAAAGGGGVPVLGYFTPHVTASFTGALITASAPATIQFSNNSNSELLSDGVATFIWFFGDGVTSNATHPTHTFTTTGSFPISLRVTAQRNGITSSFTQSVNIVAPTVTADFTTNVTTGSHPLTVNFTNKTITNNSANTLAYGWAFGSGSGASTATNPSFTYTATGSYTILLGATGSFGVTSTKTHLILVT